MTAKDNGASMYEAMSEGIRAAIEVGTLDESTQAAPIAGALELARKIDRAMHGPSEQQLKLLLDYCKSLGMTPAQRAGRTR